MKKRFLNYLISVIVLLTMLSGCGSIEEDTSSKKAVEDLNFSIDSLFLADNEFDISDVGLYDRIVSQYNELSDSQKAQIINYDKVTALSGKIEELRKIKEDLDTAYDLGVSSLKRSLKNPSSYNENDAQVCGSKDNPNKYYVKIKYSATNSFGGVMEGTYLAIVENGKIKSESAGDAQYDWDVFTHLDFDHSRFNTY